MSRPPEAQRDLASAAGLAALGALYLFASREYPLDSLATPGPGVFPFAVGVLTLGVAAGQAAWAVRRRSLPDSKPSGGVLETRSSLRAPHSDESSMDARPRRWLGQLIAMVLLLIAYAGSIGLIGFLPASFLLVTLASRLLGARGWVRPAGLALGVTVIAHVLFVGWLGVPLPRGMLGR